jgi:hypothetical protein
MTWSLDRLLSLVIRFLACNCFSSSCRYILTCRFAYGFLAYGVAWLSLVVCLIALSLCFRSSLEVRIYRIH